jgi:hypothetical protein
VRGGSGVGVGEVDPVWLGFHIALKGFFLFCPLQDWGCQGKAKGSHPKNVNPLAVRALAATISWAAGNRRNQSSGSARTTRIPHSTACPRFLCSQYPPKVPSLSTCLNLGV